MEGEFVEAALDTLPADDLLYIMKQMTPESVIKLCQVNKAFDEFCQDDFVWVELIKEHYPLFDTTSTPKKQYQALVNKIFTYYIVWDGFGARNIIIDENGNEISTLAIGAEAILGRTAVDDIEFKIRGLPFEKDTYMWVLLYDEVGRPWGENNTQVFRTKEEAINHIIDEYYEDLLDDLELYAEIAFGDVNNGTVNQAVENHELPIPFTHDNIKRYLNEFEVMKTLRLNEMEHGIQGDAIDTWLIKRILFKAK